MRAEAAVLIKADDAPPQELGVPKGYKQTEVGVIPEDWDVTNVGDEFFIELGKMLDIEKNIGAPKFFLGNRAVQWSRIDLTDIGLIRLTRSDLLRFRLRYGDLLVCEGGEIGRAAIWKEPIPECYYQKALHRLRPKNGYNVSLMLNLLEHFSATGFLFNFVTQTSIAHLPKDKFQTVPIPLPPIAAEQEAIAEALSDADALIEGLEKLIAKKRLIKQGAMQELLTGKCRLPGFSGDWKVRQLGEIAQIVMGQSPSSANYNVSGNGLPLIQGNADVSGRETIRRVYTTQVTKLGKRGDILLSVRAPVGEVARATFDHCLGRGVCAVRCDSNLMYHVLIFMENEWAKLSKGSTFDSVNSKEVNTFEVKWPPDLGEQQAIVAILDDLDSQISNLGTKLSKARQIKQGMMQELLTGRIRLV